MTNPNNILAGQVTLPCGAIIKNRFFKSAMSEAQSTVDNRPTPGLSHLYKTWAEGGCGLLVTGNVMIDRKALGEPRNVVLEPGDDLTVFKQWAASGKANQTHLWVQLNHPGKQSPKNLSPEPVAPSSIPLKGGLKRLYATPRTLTEEEIFDIIGRFACAAGLVKRAGFTGIQIHAAHGYLVSQFLSPLHNQRTDRWGGTLSNRIRFLSDLCGAIRMEVGAEYPVGIKLNSADFQRGGFTEAESLEVIEHLDGQGVDLIELSGGNYESPAMIGVRQSTRDREAYFIDFAEKLKGKLRAALVVTGGFRSARGMTEAVSSGATDLVGIARPLAIEPDLPRRILAGEPFQSKVKPLSTGISIIDKYSPLEITWYEQQLALIAQGKKPNPNLHPGLSLVKTAMTLGLQTFQRRRSS